MPDLPSMTLTQEHYDRVVAAFPGADPTAKTAAYRAWLTNRLIDRVEMVEFRRIDAESTAARNAALATLAASLPPRVVEP